MPLKAWNAGIKEGRIGFFMNDAMGLEITNLTFYADDCTIPDVEHRQRTQYLISPYTYRYQENYKGAASHYLHHYTMSGSKPDGQFTFGEGVGKHLRVLYNQWPTFNPKAKIHPSIWASYKDKTMLCYDDCITEFAFMINDKGQHVEKGNLGYAFKYIDELK